MIKGAVSRFIERVDWLKVSLLWTDRLATLSLTVHFLIFLTLPLSLMTYVSDQMLGGNSRPETVNGNVVITMPKTAWEGFFWFSNFYGALTVFSLFAFCLYFFWNRASRQEPIVKTGVKCASAIVVASGLPLKIIYQHFMIMPITDKVVIKALQIFDLTAIAMAPYYRLEGPWFLTKVIILCPIGYLLALSLYFYRVKFSNNNQEI